MVKQVTYAQGIKELGEKQEVAVNSSLKTLHPFIDNEGLLRVGGRLQHSTLPYQTRHQMREILDPKDQKPGEDSHPSMPDLLQTKGTGNPTIHG